MPLETGTYLSDLVVTNPAHTDGLNAADGHLRLIKQALKNTFPNINGAVSLTDEQLNALFTDGTSLLPVYTFASEPTLGFYRSASGIIQITGGVLRGKGAVPVGSLHTFLVEPSGLGKASTGTGHDYLELDGSTWNNSDFPALAAHLGQGGSTFTLKNAKDTGRFLRSRTTSVTAGTAQSNTVGPHTHPDATATTGGESAAHTHVVAGDTGTNNVGHTHGQTVTTGNTFLQSGGSFSGAITLNATQTGGESNPHTHHFSATSAGPSADHTHNVTVSTPANTGTTETRPEALSVIFCIKT